MEDRRDRVISSLLTHLQRASRRQNALLGILSPNELSLVSPNTRLLPKTEYFSWN